MRAKRSISLLLLGIGICVALGDAAPVNLNVKSGLLSRLLGNSSKQSKPEELHGSSSSTASAERPKGKVSLDLSGTYHCLVVGPSSQNGGGAVEGAPIPLFQTGSLSKGWSPPSLILSVGYNFSQTLQGATRLLTSLSWSYRKNEPETTSSPFTVSLQGEKGLLEPDDYAAQVGISLKSSLDVLNPPLLAQLRWERHCKQVTVAAPLHKRVGLVWKSIFPTQPHESSHDHFSSRTFPVRKEDWWIPNLKINTAGRLTADNEVGFLTNKKRRMGVRLMLSRQLGWSAFGGGIIDDHLGTLVKLQVTGADDGGESFSTATIESVLERPLESTHLTLSHEQVHKN